MAFALAQSQHCAGRRFWLELSAFSLPWCQPSLSKLTSLSGVCQGTLDLASFHNDSGRAPRQTPTIF
eukprot:6384160-Lingulodinium_polyedra.AAC.1